MDLRSELQNGIILRFIILIIKNYIITKLFHSVIPTRKYHLILIIISNRINLFA